MIGGVNLVLGLLAVFWRSEALLGMGASSIIFGLIFVVLGFFVQRKSAVALILAIIIFVLDGVLGALILVSQGVNPMSGGILIRIVFLIPTTQGLRAIKTLKL